MGSSDASICRYGEYRRCVRKIGHLGRTYRAVAMENESFMSQIAIGTMLAIVFLIVGTYLLTKNNLLEMLLISLKLYRY